MREGWTYKKLGEVGIVVTGSTPSTKDEANYASPDYCFVKPSDLPSEGIAVIDESEFHISSKAFNSARQLPKGSVVVSCIGIIGKVGILNKQACTNQQINAIIPNDTILPKCLAYIICNNKRELEQIANAPIVPIINKSEFSKFSIPVPPLSEQQSIVVELDKINELISLKKAQLSDLDSLAQSIFYDMFGDPIANEKGWEVKKLGEVGEIVAGSTPSTNDEENWGGNINWVTPAELGDQLFYGETVRKLTEKGAKRLIIMPVGTVLLSSRAPIGKLAITTVPMCCNQGFKNIICNDSINNIFLYFYLLNTIESVKSMGRGATFKEVSKTAISSYNVPLPPLYLQQEFAKRIELIEQQKVQINSTIKDLETLLASRMQYWFD